MATCVESSVKNIALSEIRIDGGTQCRVSLNEDTVKEYTELLVGEFEFPPAVVYFDGSNYWMADGFHRYFAYQNAHIDAIPCEVNDGTREDAQWHAYGANKGHGLRRTNADKQRAVELALKHPRGAELANSLIAEHVGVGDDMVAKKRSELEATSVIRKSEARIGKDGRKLKTSSAKRSESAKRKNAAKKNDEPAKPSNVEMDEPLEVLEEFDETREELEATADAEPESPPEPEKTTEVFDRLKRRVPEQFVEVFIDASKFDDIRNRLNELKNDFQALCNSKCGIFLTPQSVMADIENLKHALKFARPYTVCPYCKGNGCKACRHQGWAPEGVYKSSPGEMK